MSSTWWVDSSQLDDAQKAVVLDPPESDLLILGPPGSGKTNILVLRANYVRSVAPRLLLLTFTRTLTEFLRSGPNVGREDQIKASEITTFNSWGRGLLRDQKAQIPESTGDFGRDRDNLIDALNDMIDGEGLGQLYDVAFVDEVQDLTDSELQVLRRLTHRINAAGDSRQEIYRQKEGLDSISALVTKTVVLTKHYRVGERICEFADQILPPKVGERPLAEGCNYPEEVLPSSVETELCVGQNDRFERCIERLRDQRRYIVDEPIGVFARTRDMRDAFWERLSCETDLAPISMVQQQDHYQAFGSESLIRVMTVHSAKGLECRAVHLLDAEEYGTDRRELAFTAVTRAKTEVALYHVGPLPGHMRPPTNQLPTLDDLF